MRKEYNKNYTFLIGHFPIQGLHKSLDFEFFKKLHKTPEIEK